MFRLAKPKCPSFLHTSRVGDTTTTKIETVLIDRNLP